MNGGIPVGPGEVCISVHSGRFEDGDERWTEQVEAFGREFTAEVPGVTREAVDELDKKGVEAGSIILSLVSAGVLTTAVEFFKSWIGRDRSRSVKVTWSEHGQLTSIELAGHELDGASFEEIALWLRERLGGSGEV